MGVPQAAVGAFLAVAWLVTLALPSGWHRVYGHGLKNYDVGLYKYEVSKGTAGQVASAVGGAIGTVGKVDVGKAMDGAIGDGSYWMNQAEEDQCAPFVDVVAFPGSREWCDMWRRMKIASFVAAVCIAVGALLAGASAGLSFNTTKQGESVSKLRKAGGFGGPTIGLLGMAIYFFMTMDFPDPVDSQKELTLGGAYWAALVFAVLLIVVAAWTTFTDKETALSSDVGPHTALAGGQYSPAACELGGQLPGGQGPPAFQADYQTFGGAAVPACAVQAQLSPRDQALSSMAAAMQNLTGPNCMVPGQGPLGAGFRPDPLPPPNLNTNNLGQLPHPGTLSMPVCRSPSPAGSTSPLAFQTPQGSHFATQSQPPMPWGFTAPPARDNIPGLSKSHPFD